MTRTVPNAAQYIFNEPTGRGRNRYVLFRKAFDLKSIPPAAKLHLFADTRYRLIINGTTVSHGPARFFKNHPEYDTHEIAAHLRPGRNVIAVVVNVLGGVTFQNEAGQGALIVWTDIPGTTLVSDTSWKALESPGHRTDTHTMSFAIGPAEQYDARRLPVDWFAADFDDSAWPQAQVIDHAGDYAGLSPRSIALLDEREVVPERFLGAFEGRPGEEDWYSLRLVFPGAKGLHTKARVAVRSWIHSSIDQSVTLGVFWGRYWVNGAEVKPENSSQLPLRQAVTVTLKAGWNSFDVYETKSHDWWDYYLALPRGKGLALSAEKQIDSPHIFAYAFWEDALADVADRQALPLSPDAPLPAELAAGGSSWQLWPRNKTADSPVRERAWRTFSPIQLTVNPPSLRAAAIALKGPGVPTHGSIALLFDFGGEVLGRPRLRFSAAAGTIVDLSYTERLRPDGSADVHGNFFLDFLERFTTVAGAQSIHTFHPRGMRYLEVLVTGDLAGFRLESVALTRAQYPVRLDVSSFDSSSPMLNRIWAIGKAAQNACMEDAFLDCPYRERGVYAGDCYVQFHNCLAAFGDTALFRRTWSLFLQGQGANGTIPGGAHGLLPGRHVDYSAIILPGLLHYWELTGDLEYLREMLPRTERLLAGIAKYRRAGESLVDCTGLDPYVDIALRDVRGVNAPVNAFLYAAFADGARVLDLVGTGELAAHYRGEAVKLAEAFQEAFWDNTLGAFVDRRRSDVPDTTPSVAANSLALLYDLATEAQRPRVLAWLLGALADNIQGTADKRSYRVNSYFSYFALKALYKFGKVAEAERFMLAQWQPMVDAGAWTTWEYFNDTASRCHAWSACPTWFLSTQALGVHFPTPGEPNHVHIRPNSNLAWAAGIFPHPAGPITIAWRKTSGGVQVDYKAPPGVRITH